MTDISPVLQTCSQCGNRQRAVRLNSISFFDAAAPDLDLRPGAPTRYFVGHINECEACGFCGPDLEELIYEADEVMRRPEYTGLASAGLPRRLLLHRRWAMIASSLCPARRAAEAWHWCAWAADDEGEEQLAVEFRVQAAQWYECVRERRAWRDADPGAVEGITADLWRRARQWDRARRAAEWGLEVAVDEQVRSVLVFQRALVEREDAACYTRNDVGR